MESKNFNYLLGSENEVPKDFDIDQRDDPDVGCKKLYDDEIIAFFEIAMMLKTGSKNMELSRRFIQLD